jgi:hypothetical protein
MNSDLESSWPQSKRDALIRLLDDDDPDIYACIRKTILSIGKPAQKWLQPYTLSDNKLIRLRAQEILRHCEFKRADEDLLVFCLGRGDLDLETGLWLFAKSADPSINLSALKILFDDMVLQYRDLHPSSSKHQQTLVNLHDYLTRFIRVQVVTEIEHAACLYIDKVLTMKVAHRDLVVVFCMLAAKRFGIEVEAIMVKDELGLFCPKDLSWIGVPVCEPERLRLLPCEVDIHEALTGRQMLLRICTSLHHLFKRTSQDKSREQNLYYLIALADPLPGFYDF